MVRRILLIASISGLLFGCGGGSFRDSAPDGYPDLSHTPDAVPRAEPYKRANMRTYTVLGQTYHPLKSANGFVQRGVASWYGRKFHGNKTANGERYDMYAMTAAHRRLPLPSYVQVRNLENGRTTVVRVNDRGPFHDNRIIDLSYAAASKLGMLGKGTARVEIRAIDPRRPQVVARPAPAPATQVSGQASRIFVQVGAFGSAANAQRLADRISQELQRNVRIKSSGASDARIHRVQVGPLASLEVANRITATLEGLAIVGSQVLVR